MGANAFVFHICLFYASYDYIRATLSFYFIGDCFLMDAGESLL